MNYDFKALKMWWDLQANQYVDGLIFTLYKGARPSSSRAGSSDKIIHREGTPMLADEAWNILLPLVQSQLLNQVHYMTVTVRPNDKSVGRNFEIRPNNNLGIGGIGSIYGQQNTNAPHSQLPNGYHNGNNAKIGALESELKQMRDQLEAEKQARRDEQHKREMEDMKREMNEKNKELEGRLISMEQEAKPTWAKNIDNLAELGVIGEDTIPMVMNSLFGARGGARVAVAGAKGVPNVPNEDTVEATSDDTKDTAQLVDYNSPIQAMQILASAGYQRPDDMLLWFAQYAAAHPQEIEMVMNMKVIPYIQSLENDGNTGD